MDSVMDSLWSSERYHKQWLAKQQREVAEARERRVADAVALLRAYMAEVVGVPVGALDTPVLDAERREFAERYYASAEAPR